MTIVIDAFAIVSANDCIADANGRFPPELMNDADWVYFQNELDHCDYVVVGRASHDATPNVKKRRRIVMSLSARGLEQRDDALFWNPAHMDWLHVCEKLLPRGGRIGVPGGQAAFDFFLRAGLSSFHLSRAQRITLRGGRGVFAGVDMGQRAEDILFDAGLRAGDRRVMDAQADVTLTVWQR